MTEESTAVPPFSVVADEENENGGGIIRVRRNVDMVSRKTEEEGMRRYEAAGWLRKTVGFVLSKDLPEEPSEEELRVGLRSGIILCSALNKVLPGSVPRVVEKPSVSVADGAALSAYQYFENVRNFLDTVQQMGIPSFEPSDFEQGGKTGKIVNCVLALKSYSEWKQGGGNTSSLWKFGGGTLKSNNNSGRCVVRKNSELFTSSVITKNQPPSDDKSLDEEDDYDLQYDPIEMTTQSLNMFLRAALSNKKPEEVPMLVEAMLSKVMEEVELRLSTHNVLLKGEKDIAMTTNREEVNTIETTKYIEVNNTKIDKYKEENDREVKEGENATEVKEREERSFNRNKEQLRQNHIDEEAKDRLLKQQLLLDQQQRDIQELKHALQNAKAGMQLMQTQHHEEFNDLGKHLNVLTHAASRYHRVLEENRKLYNQVQDLKGNIRVYCRVRPFIPGRPSRSSIVDHIDEGSIEIITPSKYGKEGRKSFNFNKVFGPSATQEEVFLDTRPLIRSVLDGFNVCIFAYGQTGSGKTHTMTGPTELTEETQGVNFRALNDLFLISEQRKETFQYEVSVQMMEIYNEQLRDLLVTDGLNKRLEIHNSSQGLNVPDANLVHVSSTSDVIELMNVGQKNRAVCTTAMNDRSSRSHSCLTVHVQGKDLTSGTLLRGCMHLVDLAGSERVNKSEVTGDRLKEAVHINKSLSALGDVIASLAQKNSHVPYRNSKLTQLLQDSLGGHAKTLMFVHISPEPDAVGETLSTLKFAERVATVELGAAKTNTGNADVKELKEQIASLKAALARKEGGESAHLPRSISSSSIASISSIPETLSLTKTAGSLPLYSDIVTAGPISYGQQPVEGVGNIDEGNEDKEDEEELCTSSSWVDKAMVNKQGIVNGHGTQKLPGLFNQRCSSKVYPEQNNGVKKENHDFEQRPMFETTTTYDSDDHDSALTSDSSEPDLLRRSNLPKVPILPTSTVSKLRKPSQKPTRSSDQNSMHKSSSIPKLAPSPARKISNGTSPPLHKNGRPVSADGKKRYGK